MAPLLANASPLQFVWFDLATWEDIYRARLESAIKGEGRFSPCFVLPTRPPLRRKPMVPYKIISADSHMCEPPDLWVERIDRRFRDRAPRIVKNPDGKKGSFFVCESMPPLNISGAF